MEIDQMGNSEEAFKEAGIEGIEEEVEMSDEELLKGLEEAGLTPKQEESDEYTIPEDEEPTLAFDEEAGEESEEGAILEEEPFESDIEISDEEERILSEDIDLEADRSEEPNLRAAGRLGVQNVSQVSDICRHLASPGRYQAPATTGHIHRGAGQ